MNEFSIEKLFFSPGKVKKILKKNGVDNTAPISVEISLTDSCNLNCVWCSDYNLRQRTKGSMKMKTLLKLIRDLKKLGVKGVVIEGGGEPTIYPDFEKVVGYVKKLRMSLGLITNGVMPLNKKIIRKFDWIRVSLDAANREQFKRFKGKDCFDVVMSNIEKIGSEQKTVLGIGYVVAKGNTDHLEELVERVKAAGAKYIHFRPVIDSPKLKINLDLNYLKKFEDDDFTVIINPMEENKIRGNNGLPCLTHSLTSIIGADGSVHFCGRLNIYDWWKPLGNVNKTDFIKIWKGKNRAKAAKTVKDASFCLKYCPECRMTKFNCLTERLRSIRTKRFI